MDLSKLNGRAVYVILSREGFFFATDGQFWIPQCLGPGRDRGVKRYVRRAAAERLVVALGRDDIRVVPVVVDPSSGDVDLESINVARAFGEGESVDPVETAKQKNTDELFARYVERRARDAESTEPRVLREINEKVTWDGEWYTLFAILELAPMWAIYDTTRVAARIDEMRVALFARVERGTAVGS